MSNVTMTRQDPNPNSDLSGNPPMVRQDPNTPDNAINQHPMARQNPNIGSTDTPPEGGFAPVFDTLVGTPQVRQTQVAQTTVLRDYQHAKKIFVDSNFRLSPKYGFLFYVEFDFNPLISLVDPNTTARELGMLVKSVTLPKFSLDIKVHNAYNRKNIVQNKINYDPISIVFHDDQADDVRNFWYDYYSYYYRDSDYADATYSAYHKYQSRPTFDWGYTPRPAVGYNNANGTQPYQYIQAIRIYSLYQQQFSEYELINPTITRFAHGDHANGENTSLLQHEMTVQYEAVKYLTGSVTNDTVGGFELHYHYDTTPSPNIADGGPNGQAPGNQTNSDHITDLANNSTAINPMLRSDRALFSTAINPSTSLTAAMSNLTQVMSASSGTNAGGYSIPALGSLTQGVTNSAMIGQQLTAAGVGLIGQSVNSLANGLTGQLAAGLGPGGGSIVGLVASAIANPASTLKTVENMAMSIALGVAINTAETAISKQIASVTGPEGLGGLLNQAGSYLREATTPLLVGAQNAAGSVASFTDASGNQWTVNSFGSATLLTTDGTTVTYSAANAPYTFQQATNAQNLQQAPLGQNELATGITGGTDLVGNANQITLATGDLAIYNSDTGFYEFNGLSFDASGVQQ